MQQEHDNQDQGELCVNGCGFFGSKANSGLCSVCWKKAMSKSTANATTTTANASTLPTKANETTFTKVQPLTSSSATDLTFSTMINSGTGAEIPPATTTMKTAEAAVPVDVPVQKNRKRCMECNKKVGLTGIECRCGYVYCGLHRYPDQHKCTFDFKTLDRQELAKRNPGGGAFNKMERL